MQREEVLEQALHVLEREGIANTTPEMVAAAAQCPTEEIQRYWPDREALLYDALRYLSQRVDAWRRQLIYNDRTGDKGARYPGFGAVIVDVDSGARRQLPMPVYVVAPSSAWALSVNYRRLYVTHETIGYSEPGQPFELPLAPLLDPANYGRWQVQRGSQLHTVFGITQQQRLVWGATARILWQLARQVSGTR